VSESWSATLTGWPSVTDSEVKEYERADIGVEAYFKVRKPTKLKRSPSPLE
jgi:hypothetical protein